MEILLAFGGFAVFMLALGLGLVLRGKPVAGGCHNKSGGAGNSSCQCGRAAGNSCENKDS